MSFHLFDLLTKLKIISVRDFIKKGYLIADAKLEFDKNGNIKDDYNINGFVKDGKIDLFKKHKLEKINFIFNIRDNKTLIKDLKFNYNSLNLEIKIKCRKHRFRVSFNGELRNKNLIEDNEIIKNFIKNENLNIKKLIFTLIVNFHLN